MADVTNQGADVGFKLPTKIMENSLLSPVSEAHLCFVNQQFSNLLQAYLIDYVMSVSSEQSVYS